MEEEIGRVKKNDSTDIVIKIDDFGGSKGITIREYVKTGKFTGFTKSGTRIPADKWSEFLKIIGKVQV